MVENYNRIELEKICVNNGLVRGPFGGALKKEIFVKSGYKVYEQKNAIYRNCNIGDYYIDEEKYNELSRFKIRYGDFIISCSGTIGKIYRIPNNAKTGVINQALLKITIDEKICNPTYFYKYFAWDKFQKEITDDTQGGAMKNLVGMDIFKSTLISLPELKEQQAIADALSDVDTLIISLEKMIEKKKAIKQGAMQELLTGKKRLAGFEGNVKYEKLKLMCDTFCDGDWIESKDQSKEGVRLIQTGNIGVGRFINKADKKRYISEETFYRLNCTEIKPNDILVSRLPEPAGRACIIPNMPSKMITSVDCTIIRFTNDYNPNLFIQYSQSKLYQDQINLSLGGSTRQRISRNELGNILIPVFPTKEEQNAIASILNSFENEILGLESKLSKYRQIKQGMTQELLTGRIRLI